MYSKILLFALMLLFAINSQGQNQFAFYKNGTYLYTASPKGKPAILGKGVKVKKSKIIQSAKTFTYSTMPKEVLTKIPIADSMVFYSALQGQDGHTWLFVERNMDLPDYHFCAFDAEKGIKTILFTHTSSPDAQYAFKPIAWSADKSIVYIEALVFGSATENEGIWSYNMTTQQFVRLPLTPGYRTTPVISPDKKYLLYGATSGAKGPESQTNQIWLFDLQKNKETLIQQDTQAFYGIVGWTGKGVLKTDLLKIDEKDTSVSEKKNDSAGIVQQIDFKLPWAAGGAYCVSRTGSLLPNMNFPATCTAPTCGPYSGDHGYQAFDFPIPLQTNVLAVAPGTVVFAWFNATGTQTLTGGFGNLVKIKHSDNTYTYYAHLNSIGVKVGDVVGQGCIIGKLGNTGHSSGPHLHFEWRDVGDVKFNDDDFWPVFTEYACTPNQNKLYTSQNTQQTCTSNFNLNCANAVTLNCGQSYEGATTGKQSSSNNATTGDYSNVNSNPYTTWNDPGPEDVYKITTTTPGDITATLTNTATGLDLDVFILNNCGVNTNPGNVTVTSTTCTMTNAPAGTYYILVDGYASMYPAGQSSTPYNGHYGSYTITVNCTPVCSYSLSAASATVTAGDTTLNLAITAPQGCNWSAATSGCNWLTLNNATSSGNGTVLIQVAENTSTTSRTCTITVEGQSFTITQNGALPCATAPLAPGNLSVSISGNNQTHLSWSGSLSNVSTMEVERAAAPGGPFSFLAATGLTPSYTDNSGTPGTTYYYRVRSCCETNCSPWSNVVSIQACAYSAAATAITSSPGSICPGGSVELSIQGGAAGTGAVWTWRADQCDTGPVIASGTSMVTVTPAVSRNYFVKPEGGYCGPPVACAAQLVTVNQIPMVNLPATAVLSQGQPVTLDATVPGLTYLWSTGATTAAITVQQAGTYSITVTNTSGCTASGSVIVSGTTATGDIPEDQFRMTVSPNPTDGIVSISCSGGASTAVAVIDPLGRKVLEEHTLVPDGGTRILDLGKLPAGSYGVQITGTWGVKTVLVVRN